MEVKLMLRTKVSLQAVELICFLSTRAEQYGKLEVKTRTPKKLRYLFGKCKKFAL